MIFDIRIGKLISSSFIGIRGNYGYHKNKKYIKGIQKEREWVI